MKEFDYNSIEHAHFRIDEHEKELKKLYKSFEKIADFQEKTAKSSNAIKWLVIGGLAFYVLENIGLVEFIKSVA